MAHARQVIGTFTFSSSQLVAIYPPDDLWQRLDEIIFHSPDGSGLSSRTILGSVVRHCTDTTYNGKTRDLHELMFAILRSWNESVAAAHGKRGAVESIVKEALKVEVDQFNLMTRLVGSVPWIDDLPGQSFKERLLKHDDPTSSEPRAATVEPLTQDRDQPASPPFDAVTPELVPPGPITHTLGEPAETTTHDEATRPKQPVNPIPCDYWSRPLTLSAAGKYKGFKGDGRSRREQIRGLIKKGTLQAYKEGRQSFVFDLRQFPQCNRDKMRPDR